MNIFSKTLIVAGAGLGVAGGLTEPDQVLNNFMVGKDTGLAFTTAAEAGYSAISIQDIETPFVLERTKDGTYRLYEAEAASENGDTEWTAIRDTRRAQEILLAATVAIGGERLISELDPNGEESIMNFVTYEGVSNIYADKDGLQRSFTAASDVEYASLAEKRTMLEGVLKEYSAALLQVSFGNNGFRDFTPQADFGNADITEANKPLAALAGGAAGLAAAGLLIGAGHLVAGQGGSNTSRRRTNRQP